MQFCCGCSVIVKRTINFPLHQNPETQQLPVLLFDKACQTKQGSSRWVIHNSPQMINSGGSFSQAHDLDRSIFCCDYESFCEKFWHSTVILFEKSTFACFQ